MIHSIFTREPHSFIYFLLSQFFFLASLEITEKLQTATSKTEENCLEENCDGKPFAANLNAISDVRDSCLSIKVDTDSSKSDDSEGCCVYDDDILQRKLELRESKINDLLRKQEGLLQTIEKMATKPLPRD